MSWIAATLVTVAFSAPQVPAEQPETTKSDCVTIDQMQGMWDALDKGGHTETLHGNQAQKFSDLIAIAGGVEGGEVPGILIYIASDGSAAIDLINRDGCSLIVMTMSTRQYASMRRLLEAVTINPRTPVDANP